MNNKEGLHLSLLSADYSILVVQKKAHDKYRELRREHSPTYILRWWHYHETINGETQTTTITTGGNRGSKYSIARSLYNPIRIN